MAGERVPFYSDGRLGHVDDWKSRQRGLMGRMTMLTVSDGTSAKGRRHVFPLVLLGAPLVLAGVLLLILKIKGYL